MTPEEIKNEYLKHKAAGYQRIRHNEDGSVFTAIIPLAFTTSIAFHLDDGGFKERYCFPDALTAFKQQDLWLERGFNAQRPVGWIACRNVNPIELKESFEEHYRPDYAHHVLDVYKSIYAETKAYVTDEQIMKAMDNHDVEIKHFIAYLRVTRQMN